MSKDRKDGRYIKPNDAIHAIMPYLMEKRTESEVYKSQIIDITELKKWVDTKNKELDFKMTYFHALTALLVKVLYNRNLLNRFVQGHRIYERNYVSVTFAAKDKMSDNAEEKMIVLKIDKKDNGVKLAKKMAVDIFKVRKEGTNDLDQTLKVITRMPRWLLRIFAKFVKWLDYHGWLPSSFTDTDPNYSTLLLSNLGSIKSDSCYHHLNNYGTNSIIITIGLIREEKGKTLVDLSATLDERIADGFYFVKSMNLAQYIASNPEILEEELGKIIKE